MVLVSVIVCLCLVENCPMLNRAYRARQMPNIADNRNFGLYYVLCSISEKISGGMSEKCGHTKKTKFE